jgi:hypothetical protein
MSFFNTRGRRLALVVGLVWAAIGATLAYVQIVRAAEIAKEAKLVSCITYTQITVCPVFAQLAYDRTMARYWYLAAEYILVPMFLMAVALKILNWIRKAN